MRSFAYLVQNKPKSKVSFWLLDNHTSKLSMLRHHFRANMPRIQTHLIKDELNRTEGDSK